MRGSFLVMASSLRNPQIGTKRLLFGSDGFGGGNLDVAPYVR